MSIGGEIQAVRGSNFVIGGALKDFWALRAENAPP